MKPPTVEELLNDASNLILTSLGEGKCHLLKVKDERREKKTPKIIIN